jgi:SNF2 family DNA or RNA helicase
VGKTAQAVIAAQQLRAKSVRVICPAVGMEHWRREFRRWWVGSKLPELEIMSFDQARVQSRAMRTGQGHTPRVDILVLDECHYAKNPDAARTLAVFGKGGFGWYADHIWALSGTPAPNNAAELWPMLRAYGATKLDYESFKHRFCVVDALGKVRGTKHATVPELRGLLAPFMLRRRKRDVLPELGEIDVQEWYVKPGASFVSDAGFADTAKREEAELRRAIQKLAPEDLLTFLAGHEEFATVRRYNALLKVPAVFEQVMGEMDSGLLDKIVIYGWHKEPLEILEREFNKAKVGAVLVNGDTPPKLRDGLVQEWKRPSGPRVMLASIVAAGVVLDFTESHQGIMLECSWVNADNTQAMQRMHRHGQTNPVTIRVAIGSEIDEVINTVLVRKARDFAATFDGT